MSNIHKIRSISESILKKQEPFQIHNYLLELSYQLDIFNRDIILIIDDIIKSHFNTKDSYIENIYDFINNSKIKYIKNKPNNTSEYDRQKSSLEKELNLINNKTLYRLVNISVNFLEQYNCLTEDNKQKFIHT